MKEIEQRALKQQPRILLVVLLHSEFLRYRAVDAVNMPHAQNLLRNGMDSRHRVPTAPLHHTTSPYSTAPTETRNEGKYNRIHKQSFILKTTCNSDWIVSGYTQPLKQDYQTSCWHAPEDIIIIAHPTFSSHVSHLLPYAAQQHLS